MGLTKVFGAILILMSTLIGITCLFVFLNSSAFFDYNTGETARLMERMTNEGILIPLMICAMAWIFGFLLAKDHVIEEH